MAIRVFINLMKGVNRIATVTKISPFQYGHYVEFLMEGTQEKIIGEAFSNNLRGIGPVDDLMKARSKYRGKTLWTKDTLNTYNEELDEEGRDLVRTDPRPHYGAGLPGGGR